MFKATNKNTNNIKVIDDDLVLIPLLSTSNVCFGALRYFFLCYFNPLVPNAPFFYPLKTSENRKVHWEQMS